MIINARFRDRHRDTFSLHAGGRDVGQLTADAIRFHGFASAADARDAADAAATALEAWWRQRGGTTLAAAPRVIAPAGAGAPDQGHAFELAIPPDLWTATRLGLAQRLFTAIAEEPAVT